MLLKELLEDAGQMGLVGRAILFDKAGRFISQVNAQQAVEKIKQAQRFAEIKQSSFDKLKAYLAGGKSKKVEELRSTVDELEGYDVDVYHIDGGQTGFSPDTKVILVVNG